MEQKILITFEATKGEKNERKYTLMIPYGCPFGEVVDFCADVSDEILKQRQEAINKAKKEKEEAEKNVKATVEVAED